MTESEAKYARENFNQHKAQEEYAALSPRLNPTGRLYKERVKQIRRKWGVNEI